MLRLFLTLKHIIVYCSNLYVYVVCQAELTANSKKSRKKFIKLESFIFIKVCNIFILKKNQKHKKIRKSLNFRFFPCNFCQGQSWTCIRKTYKTWNIFARNYKEKPIEKNEPPKGTSLTTISILIWIATVKYYYCGKFFPRSVSIQESRELPWAPRSIWVRHHDPI